VQYPISGGQKTPKPDRDFLLELVKGPNACWDPTDYDWTKIPADPPETVTKRPRLGPMLAPLCTPPHLSLAQYEASIGSGGLDELILPGLDDLLDESMAPTMEESGRSNQETTQEDVEGQETSCSGMEFLQMD
jgi:hypothetical protein